MLTDNTSTASVTRGFHLIKDTANTAYISNYENTATVFSTNNKERMRIASNGNIGIGVTNPTSLLHVNGEILASTNKIVIGNTNNPTLYLRSSTGRVTMMHNDGTNKFYILSGTVNQDFWSQVNGNWPLMIALENNNAVFGADVNANSFTTRSDKRIKKDIEDIDDVEGLNKLLLIEPKKYNYVNDNNNVGRYGKIIGFIAQQVKEVIPEAIYLIQGTPPNIYKTCQINNKREVYCKIQQDVAIDTEVSINGTYYKIKEIYDDYFVIDNDIDTDEAFVFGYRVDDFHTINKDYIFTLNVCATQELHRRIEAQNITIKSHEDRIKDLEEKVERLLTNT
jgi:hypothetical protein